MKYEATQLVLAQSKNSSEKCLWPSWKTWTLIWNCILFNQLTTFNEPCLIILQVLSICSSICALFIHESERESKGSSYVCILQNLHTSRLMGSTNQANPSSFYFRISWIFMERHCPSFFLSSIFYRVSEASNIDSFKN